jgi:hypothetical protein
MNPVILWRDYFVEFDHTFYRLKRFAPLIVVMFHHVQLHPLVLLELVLSRPIPEPHRIQADPVFVLGHPGDADRFLVVAARVGVGLD